jgi:alpha-glucosidase
MTTIYQIYPRSFQDSNGDGVGDLRGIVDRLPYLAKLGVDMVWISPFFLSPQKDFGYDVSDYRTVDPLFGSNADLAQLIADAAQHNLGIMVDLVLAHSSNQHPWFLESRASRDNPKADWYVWADPLPDGNVPNNWQSVFGGSAWRWEPRRQQYYLTHFLGEQPALNLYAPAMREELLAVVEYWLQQGVKGFRFDAIHFAHYDPQLRNNPPAPRGSTSGALSDSPFGMQDHVYDLGQPATIDFIRDIRKVAERYPGALLLGEVGTVEIARTYVGADKFDLSYSFNMLDIRELVTVGLFREKLAGGLAGFLPGTSCWALSNHDAPRHVTRMGSQDPSHRAAFAKMIAAVVLTLPGGLCLYQGEELGLPTAELRFEDLVDPYDIAFYPDHVGRDGARTPMPWVKDAANAGFSTAANTWLPVDAAQQNLAVDSQEEDPQSTLNHYRRLIAWRKNHPWIKKATVDSNNSNEQVLQLEYRHGNQAMLGLFNFAAESVELKGLGGLGTVEWQEGVSVQNDTVTLQPFAFATFTQAA